MTETTQTVFAKHEIRKTKKQKSAFIDDVTSVAASEGYACRVEKSTFGARNIVVGDPDHAKVIYGAHYDTCAVMPFPNFITPKNFLIYLLYQILIAVVLFFVPILAIELGVAWIIAAAGLQESWLALLLPLTSLLYAAVVLWLLMAGPANKHTANDNTSGVTTLLDLMTAMPQELRTEVAFLFFDLEELGTFGAMGFAGKHKKAVKNTLLINFDCVSDGDTVLFAVRRGARAQAALLKECFPETDRFRVQVLTRGVFYPSDQMNFPAGVGVAALKRAKLFGLLYMDRIHTKRDTVYCEENIAFLVDGSIRLASRLTENGEQK